MCFVSSVEPDKFILILLITGAGATDCVRLHCTFIALIMDDVFLEREALLVDTVNSIVVEPLAIVFNATLATLLQVFCLLAA